MVLFPFLAEPVRLAVLTRYWMVFLTSYLRRTVPPPGLRREAATDAMADSDRTLLLNSVSEKKYKVSKEILSAR